MARKLLVAILGLALQAGAAHAQGTVASAEKPRALRFDPSTVTTVSGRVLGEREVPDGKGRKHVHLVVDLGGEQVSVHLGPADWVGSQPVRLEKGDEVRVKGSRFTYGGRWGLIAESVSKGGETLVLRDDTGKPAWPRQAAPR